VILNGAATAINATLTGPYQSLADLEGRFFALDVPVVATRYFFSVVSLSVCSTQIFFNLYLPALTGDVVPGVSSVLNPAFGLLLLCLSYLLMY
jgi:hypothetical protein